MTTKKNFARRPNKIFTLIRSFSNPAVISFEIPGQCKRKKLHTLLSAPEKPTPIIHIDAKLIPISFVCLLTSETFAKKANCKLYGLPLPSHKHTQSGIFLHTPCPMHFHSYFAFSPIHCNQPGLTKYPRRITSYPGPANIIGLKLPDLKYNPAQSPEKNELLSGFTRIKFFQFVKTKNQQNF